MQAKFPPSRIARRMAADQWPDVQDQQKVARGVFTFSCAGHGGLVAVLDASDFQADVVELARKHGRTEFVGLHGGQLLTSERYTRETFERLRESGRPVWEVWVGEEDCDWALLALASDAVCTGLAKRWPSRSAAEVREYAHENAGRWNAEFLADFNAVTTNGRG